MSETRIRIQQQPWYAGLSVLLCEYEGDRIIGVASMTLERREPGQIVTETATIDSTAAQVLMDDLWACGIRPSEGTGSAGQLSATQKHLEDMRKITFKKLGIEG